MCQFMQNYILHARNTCFIQIIIQIYFLIFSAAATPQCTHLLHAYRRSFNTVFFDDWVQPIHDILIIPFGSLLPPVINLLIDPGLFCFRGIDIKHAIFTNNLLTFSLMHLDCQLPTQNTSGCSGNKVFLFFDCFCLNKKFQFFFNPRCFTAKMLLNPGLWCPNRCR